MAGALGLGALWRRRQREEAPASLDAGPDPAEELRSRLAESRAAAEEDAPAESEPPAGQDPEAPDPEARRRDLHERARASIDELR